MFPRAMAHALSLFAFALTLGLPIIGAAQQDVAEASRIVNPLPDAPVPQHDGSTKSEAPGTAGISGTVLDSSGAVISAAQASLLLPDGRTQQTVKTAADGQFSFTKIPAGSYLVVVNAVGFAPFQSNEFTLSEQEAYVIPEIKLAVGSSTTTVLVRPTEVIAAEQIKTEEKQRIFGVFPEFYTSFVPNTAPLTSKQKLNLEVHDSFDWWQFVSTSITAGIEQGSNAHAAYGQGAAGYGKRWGAAFADGTSADLLGRYYFGGAD